MFGYQACFSLHYAPETFYWVTENDLEVIKQHFEKQPDSLENWMNFKVELYANSPDDRIALMIMGDDVQMLYAANNQNAFEKMQSVLKNLGEPI